MSDFYQTEKVNNRITAIRSLTGEIMYIIEGNEKAALVDTCLGVGQLRKLVGSLTDKPLIVILTHGHVDHAMGAPEFDCVYMNPADAPIYEEMAGYEHRNGYLAGNLNGNIPEFAPEDYVKPFPFTYEPLSDGDSFDLGGIHLDLYALPGHTPGSMVVLIREERILILGDACNKSTFLFDKYTVPVAVYQKNLQALEEKVRGLYARVFICHHDMEVSKDIIQNVDQVCQDIIQGRTDDIPFVFMGGTYYIAKAADKTFNRPDGIEGNIIYNKDKVVEA